MARRDAAQQALVGAVRRGGAADADEDSVLFVANWTRRRQAQRHPRTQETLIVGGRVLRDLAVRLDKAGQERP